MRGLIGVLGLFAIACGAAAPPPVQHQAEPAASSPAPAPSPTPAPAPSPPSSTAPPADVDLLRPAAPPQPQTVIVTESDPCGMMFDSVYFADRAAALARPQLQIIDATAQMLICFAQHGERLLVEVQGHADLREPGAAELSERRAHAVALALRQRGVPADQLVEQGYAASRPRDRRATAFARARNRRVEFLVISHGP